MSEYKAIIERLRVYSIRGNIALLDLHLDSMAHKLAHGNVSDDERWLIQLEADILTDHKYKLLLFVALLEHKQCENLGLSSVPAR